MGRSLSPGDEYGWRPVSCARQGCGKAWSRSSDPDHRPNRAAPAIRACYCGRRGDSNRYCHAQFAERFVKVAGEGAMDENRVEGTFRKVAGKAQENVGRVTGDMKM